jgi:hypothetical protein
MKLSTFTHIGVGLLLALGANLARATPINGSINFDGTATVDTGNLATATAFTSIANAFVDPGTQTGSYSAVPNFTAATFNAFSFSASSVTPLWTFTVGGITYSFSATSISVMTPRTSSFLNLSGTGIASITGFTDTAGTFTVTDTGNGPTFTFGQGTIVAGVPDSGTTAMLIALGFAAVGFSVWVRRDRMIRA